MKVKKLKKKLKSMVELKEFLKNPSPKMKVPVYTEEEVIQNTDKSGDGTVKKLTLLTISQRLDELTKKIDSLGKDLRNEMNSGFKQVNARLDYIVSANNLKDLPKNKKI